MRTIALLLAALVGTESSCATPPPVTDVRGESTGAGARGGDGGDGAASLAPAPDQARSEAAEPRPDPVPARVTTLGPGEFRVVPRTIAWDALDASTFDRAWLLPDGRADGGLDLVADMRALLALPIALADGETTVRFADLVAEARPLAGPERRAWLATLAERAPRFHAEWGARVAELLLDDVLYSKNWKPAKDDARDGILFGPSWDLAGDERLTWRAREGAPLVEQAATVFFADAHAVKAAENDYRLYPRNVAADYEEIHPLPDQYVRGLDPQGRAFSSHQLFFRCDLPFPFSDYACRLHVLTRSGASGELVTDIFSNSRDFHYMCGRDVFLPLVTSDGATIGYLAVRLFGFDLDGVPDDASNRREAMRGALGNLRRNAERLFTESGGVFRPSDDGVPEYEVLGLEPR
jgi:hypothetical protein